MPNNRGEGLRAKPRELATLPGLLEVEELAGETEMEWPGRCRVMGAEGKDASRRRLWPMPSKAHKK